MSDNTTPRRKFIGAFLSGAAALGLTTIATPLKASEELLATEADPAEAKFKALKGKHKIVFDTPAYRSGAALAWTNAFLKTNNETGTADNDLNVVIVLRSMAIGMSMPDAIWEKYKLGELYKVDDPDTKAPAIRNIFTIADPDEKDMSIAELQKRGVLFSVCRLAIKGNSEHIAEKMNLKAEDVHKDLLSNVLPGILAVPSGVWALGRAQEKGCAYCYGG